MAEQAKTQEDRDRARRMKWWHEARFGMFVHWGLYAQLGRHEWVMNRECVPLKDYEKLADTWKPKPRPARDWARLAVKAGMKYMVMTTKHHEGFCLWDTAMTDYNAVQRGPGRDLVQEYVDACREFGIKIGFYYSLMDWRHPDSASCTRNRSARRRFLDYTHGAVRELMSNYGKIDILWYDVPWPFADADGWDSRALNSMVRRLQPHIIINNRSRLPEDFGTPEEHISAAEPGRAWEACMTFNGSWGYMPCAPTEDWHSSRTVVRMLQQVTSRGGNLLLNVGPKPDGSIPEEAVQRLGPVGRWLAKNGDAVYGRVSRIGEDLAWGNIGAWTRKGKTAYFWCFCWPGSEIAIGGFKAKVCSASLLADGRPVKFEQKQPYRLVLKGLPAKNPDRVVQVCVIKLDFDSRPIQYAGTGCAHLGQTYKWQ